MDKAEIQALYERYGHYLFGRCKQFLGNDEDAYDALHEVFLRCLRKGPQLEGARMLPWLNRVTTNYCLNVIRNRSSRRTDVRPVFDGVPDDRSQLFVVLCERHDLVTKVLAGSPTDEQEMVVAYFLDEMNLAETSEAVGISVATVRRRLKKFIERARRFVHSERAGLAV